MGMPVPARKPRGRALSQSPDNNMRFIILIGLASLALFAAGCAAKFWQPETAEGVGSENRYAVINTDSLLIAIRPQVYDGNAQAVNANFFTLHLQVRNLSKATLKLPRQSFGIVAGGRQFDPIPLEFVIGSVQTNYKLTDFEDPFTTDPLSEGTTQQYREDYFELLNSYFSFGDLLPGGSKEGYLFYSSAAGSQPAFSVDAWGRMVTFSRK